MATTILIAPDRYTNFYGASTYDYIYDEFSTFDELIEGIGANDIPCKVKWEIYIWDYFLFLKFKKDFFKINDVFPLIKSFKNISYLRYTIPVPLTFWGRTMEIESPNEKDMEVFEGTMKKEYEEWKRSLIRVEDPS